MSLCGISRRRLIAGTAAAAALSQVSAESLSIASAGREAVVYQTTSLTAEGLVAALRSVQSTLKGRIAVKFHTGEPHGPNIEFDIGLNGYVGKRQGVSAQAQAAWKF